MFINKSDAAVLFKVNTSYMNINECRFGGKIDLKINRVIRTTHECICGRKKYIIDTCVILAE